LRLYPFFLDGVATEPEYNLDDGMHPNARGVDEIVRRMAPKVAEFLSQIRP
jgi:acyl-CoA thioesterase-1